MTSLIESTDHRLVVMAPGDELTLTFDAAALPPGEGFQRDFFLHFTGWAKDNEPHTMTGRSVEPLPFLGMPFYPYPPTAVPPREPSYKRDYQTRAVPTLIPVLAPLP